MKKTARYYDTHPKAAAKKDAYNAKFNKKASAVKKRVEANAANRKAGSRKGDGMDYDHAVGRMVPQAVNRGRKGEGGRTKGKKHRK